MTGQQKRKSRGFCLLEPSQHSSPCKSALVPSPCGRLACCLPWLQPLKCNFLLILNKPVFGEIAMYFSGQHCLHRRHQMNSLLPEGFVWLPFSPRSFLSPEQKAGAKCGNNIEDSLFRVWIILHFPPIYLLLNMGSDVHGTLGSNPEWNLPDSHRY